MPEAIGLLERHSWPGNIRELANVVQRLTLLARDTQVTAADVRSIFGDQDTETPKDHATPDSALEEAVHRWARAALKEPESDGALAARLGNVADRAMFTVVMDHCHGNQLAAARMLGINRNTLRKRLGELGLHPARTHG
jgi:two-component system, NtrC family, nitrogen regulation response regulator GlnG